MKTSLFCPVLALCHYLVVAKIASDAEYKNHEFSEGNGWNELVDPLTGHSCYSLSHGDNPSPSLTNVRDLTCMSNQPANARCQSGLPFFRFPRGDAKCDGCLDRSSCQLRCVTKGLDVAGLVSDASGEVVECRCGATAGNRAVWADLRLGTAEANLGPVSYLLPPAPASALAAEDPQCRVRIFVYQDAREVDGSPARSLLALSPADAQYLRQVTTGSAAAPAWIDDSTVEEDAPMHAAVQTRLSLWQRMHPPMVAVERGQTAAFPSNNAQSLLAAWVALSHALPATADPTRTRLLAEMGQFAAVVKQSVGALHSRDKASAAYAVRSNLAAMERSLSELNDDGDNSAPVRAAIKAVLADVTRAMMSRSL